MLRLPFVSFRGSIFFTPLSPSNLISTLRFLHHLLPFTTPLYHSHLPPPHSTPCCCSCLRLPPSPPLCNNQKEVVQENRYQTYTGHWSTLCSLPITKSIIQCQSQLTCSNLFQSRYSAKQSNNPLHPQHTPDFPTRRLLYPEPKKWG